MAPLVSVVTPSFNKGALLADTIESVLSQDYSPVEYIVMDGGSTDGSVDTIKEYASRLAHWQSAPDGGHAAAVNDGWRRCRGDILAEVDASDTLAEGAILRAVAALESNPSWAMVYSDSQWIDEAGRFRATFCSRRFDLGEMLCGNYIPQPTVFIRRWALEQVGYYDDSLLMSMDFDLWMRLGQRFPIGYLQGQILASMRWHSDSKSASRSREWLAENIYVINRVIAGPRLPGVTNMTKLARGAIACASVRHAEYCLRQGLRDEARTALRAALVNPTLKPWQRYGRDLPSMIADAFLHPRLVSWLRLATRPIREVMWRLWSGWRAYRAS